MTVMYNLMLTRPSCADKSDPRALLWFRLALIGYCLLLFISGAGWAWRSDVVLTPDSGEYAVHIRSLSLLCQEGRWSEVSSYFGCGEQPEPFAFLTLFGALPFVFAVRNFALALYYYQAFVFGMTIWGAERCASRLYNGRIGVITATVFASLLLLTVSVHNCCADTLAGCLLIWSYYAFLRSEDCTSTGWTLFQVVLVSAGCCTKWSFFPIYVAPACLYLLGRYGWQSWKRHSTLRNRLLVLGGVPLASLALMAVCIGLAVSLHLHVMACLVLAAAIAPFVARYLNGRDAWRQCWFWHALWLFPVLVYYWDCWELVQGNYTSNLPLVDASNQTLIDAEFIYDSISFEMWSMGLEASRIIRDVVIAPIPMSVALICTSVALFGRRYRPERIALWILGVMPLVIMLIMFRNIVQRYFLINISFFVIAWGAVWGNVFRGLRWLLLSILITAKIIYCCGWWLPLPLPQGDDGCLNIDWMTINRDQRYHISTAFSKWKTPEYSPFYYWSFMGMYSAEAPFCFLPFLHNDWVPPIRRLMEKLRHVSGERRLELGLSEDVVPVESACAMYSCRKRYDWRITHLVDGEDLSLWSERESRVPRYYVGVFDFNTGAVDKELAIKRLLWKMTSARIWGWIPLFGEELKYEPRMGCSANTYYVVVFRHMDDLERHGSSKFSVLKTKNRAVY